MFATNSELIHAGPLTAPCRWSHLISLSHLFWFLAINLSSTFKLSSAFALGFLALSSLDFSILWLLPALPILVHHNRLLFLNLYR